MNKGIVKWFDGEKGYGFIHDDSGIDLFVHYTDLHMAGYKALDEGQAVSYEIKDGTKGQQAVRVSKIYSL